MDLNSKYFLNLLSSYINGKKEEYEKEIDYSSVYNMAINHSVGSIVYTMLESINSRNGQYEKLTKVLSENQNNCIFQLQMSIVQEIDMKNILSVLSESNIPHLLIKGYILKEMYPDRELRTMGDIDFLVKEEDIEKVHSELINLGYKHIDTVRSVRGYRKGITRIEVHTKLFYDKVPKEVNYEEYFELAWDNALLIDGEYTYELTPEYHLLYLISHIAKHFYTEGCGIRMFLDIFVFINYYENNFQWEYFWGEAIKLDLDQFINTVFYLCNKWFGMRLENIEFYLKYDFEFDEDLFNAISDYVLDSGIYGNGIENFMVARYRNSLEVNGEKGEEESHKLATLNTFFPSIDVLSNEFSYVNKYKFLYPIAWTNRAFRIVTKRRNETLYKFNNREKFKEKSKEMFNLYRKIGL